MAPPSANPFRLPKTVVPERYEIRLEPDLGRFTFAGEETVFITIREPVREIVLNAAELEIHQVSIQYGQGVVLKGEATLDPTTERARLSFPETLAPGAWRLVLTFTGVLNDKLHGFYRSTYNDKILAVTQFEATDARRAFPCWDEPDFKAVFQVTLVVPEHLQAISNTPVVSAQAVAGTGRKAVTFAATIKMSTYLVAFVVGELEATEPIRVGATPLSIWTVPGKTSLARFAQEIAAFSLAFFEQYYGLPYPGEKLDLLAIPDFAAGAMENLGAITFRETALLVDAAAASHTELERIADVMAHEIAHMWFGDLVTMAWWNGIWLNEAFATFMEMLAVDAWKPAWERWVTFGVSRAAALALDGLRSTRPIEFEVQAPKDAEAMFDLLTYEKGASVLRMLEQYLGAERFREGVRSYLSEHRYANAETTDLWQALGAAVNKPIPEMMNGWIFRGGYPMVTASVDESRRSLVLSQSRFLYLADGADESPLWQIPIVLRVGARGGVVIKTLLIAGAEERLDLPGPVEWALVNSGGHGFYRVRYAADLLRKLTRRLQHLAPIDRFNLINDAWAATVAGLMPLREYLDLTTQFRGETDRNVWTVLIGSFAYLNRVIAPDLRPKWEALVRDRLSPVVDRLGFIPEPEEGELVRQLRADLIRTIGTLGNDAPVQAEAGKLYQHSREEAGAVDPNLLPALIAILAHAGGESEYAEFVEKFRTAKTPQEEQRYLYALAGFRQVDLLARTLEKTINGEVRTQDAPFVARALLTSVYAREAAWTFVKANWQMLERQFPAKSGLRRMCEGITALATPELEADVREFFTSRQITLGGKTLEQYLEQLHVAVVFREREGTALQTYLARRFLR
ncbi:MAG: M1 family metallopeptidase [Candidatus Rokubacteria bacterium]|nr:M1 family metallopeptidase [Candidatus Rokubacteria bacterium]